MYKVLLVDDEEMIKIGLRSIIDWEKQGFSIVGSADNGLQALEKVQEIQPDVIITDLIMPKMNGIELVKALKEEKYRGLIVVLSNYGDIRYVKEAIRLGVEDYILKVSYSQEEFQELLGRLAEKLSQQVQNKEERVSVEKKASVRNYLLNDEKCIDIRLENYYQLFFIHLPEHICILNDQQYYEVLKRIQIILEEILKNKQQLEVFQKERGILVICFHTAEEPLSEEAIIPEKIKKTLLMYLMLDCTILYSTNIQGSEMLKAAYIEGIEKLAIRFYGNICDKIDNIRMNSVHELLNPIRISNRYRRYVKEHDYGKLQNELQSVVLNFQENHINPIEVKDFLRQVVVAVQLYFDEQYQYEILQGIRSKIKNASYIVQLNDIINDMMEELEKYDVSENQGDIDLLERIKKYIGDNIGNRIGLNDIASSLNFHPNYISNYFKEKTGQTVIHYINSQKMKYAKRLLENENLRIREVSEKVGFEDPLYFSRCFKKYFGYSPSKREK